MSRPQPAWACQKCGHALWQHVDRPEFHVQHPDLKYSVTTRGCLDCDCLRAKERVLSPRHVIPY